MSTTPEPLMPAAPLEPGAARAHRLGAVLAVIAVIAIAAPYYLQMAGQQSRGAWAGLHYAPVRSSEWARLMPSLAGGTGGSRPGKVLQLVAGGPADRAGIGLADTIRAVGGVAITDSAALAGVVSRARAGDVLQYRVERDGKERVVPVRLGAPLDAPRARERIVLYLLSSIVFLGVGLFVYLKRPHDPRAWLFHLLAASASVGLLLTPAFSADLILHGIGPGPAVSLSWGLGIVIACVAAVLFLSTLLHFALIFPREHPVLERHGYVLRWIYVWPYVLAAAVGMPILGLWLARRGGPLGVAFAWIAAALLVAFLWRRRRALGWRQRFAAPLETATLFLGLGFVAGALVGQLRGGAGRVVRGVVLLPATMAPLLAFFVFVIALAVLVVVVLLRSYRKSALEERQQIRWPLWSLAGNVVGNALVMVCTSWLSWRLGPGSHAVIEHVTDLTSIPLTMMIPFAFAVAILRYRLMDLDFVIRKTAIYASVTALLVLLQFALVGGLGAWFSQRLAIESHWITAFGTLAVAALFVPARNRVQQVLDRRFYRTRYAAPDSLRRVSAILGSSPDRRALALAVGEELVRTLRVRSYAMLVQDDEARAMVPAGSLGLSDETVRELRVIADKTTPAHPAGDAPIPARETHGALSVAARMARAEMVLLLRRGEATVGAVLIGGKLSEEEFDAADRDYLAAVGGQLAVGLTHLDSRSRRRELDEAREIQAGLLPRSLPDVTGYEIAAFWQPAREVAGDYYDALELADQRLALCIADVTGKGMPAALLMSNLQATVKNAAAATREPHEVCERVNRTMSANTSAGRFITLFYGVLDGPRRRLAFTNAGHNPPVLVRAEGSVCLLEKGGTLLGVFPEAAFEKDEVELAPGDRLVMFTDGVTEAMNGAGELFGDDRLVKTVHAHRAASAKELQTNLLAEVVEFCGGEFQDDATILVVAVR